MTSETIINTLSCTSIFPSYMSVTDLSFDSHIAPLKHHLLTIQHLLLPTRTLGALIFLIFFHYLYVSFLLRFSPSLEIVQQEVVIEELPGGQT